MNDLNVTVTLRPTRIGFLVRPDDLASVKRIMRVCACLWGGVYNPIIPVFKVTPNSWRQRPETFIKGYSVAKGFIQFYEPDVFVEAEEGLLEAVGLEQLRGPSIEKPVATLADFLAADYRGLKEPTFGLSIFDVMRDTYEKELQFKQRHKRQAVIGKSQAGNGLTEAVIGVYPSSKELGYFPKAFKDVFEPEEVPISPDTWLKIFKHGATTPLHVTKYKLEAERHW